MHQAESLVLKNPDYVDSLYRQYLDSPDSLPEQWRGFFAGYDLGREHGESSPPRPDGAGVEGSESPQAARVYEIVNAYRTYGHLASDLDPLGTSPREHALLSLEQFGFNESMLDDEVQCDSFPPFHGGNLRELIALLKETYCGPIGVEYMDIMVQEQRDWLRAQMEPNLNRKSLSVDEQRDLLRDLVKADEFERGLHLMYQGAKRFSLEGGTALVPLLRGLIDDAADDGIEQVVIGMAHRGRLNVLANVLEKPLEFILAEFEGIALAEEVGNLGDVKYHLGYSTDRTSPSGKDVHISLAFNPSHLETVNPVVEGIVRAKQNLLGDTERTKAMPILIHGDAAFVGQGVVAETFLLAGLEGYSTGGTVHVIVNNQVGFTANPSESRWTRYASDFARTVRTPVFHVNADHPEAVRLVTQVALGFRQRFRRDVIIDLVCFRRHGHNETDDPRFTQPKMYERVDARGSESEVYAARLELDGRLEQGVRDAMARDVHEKLKAARETAMGMSSQYLEQLGGNWSGITAAGTDWSAETRVERGVLERIAESASSFPEGFSCHRRLARLMKSRTAMVLEDGPLDWGCAEMLSIGSLLSEGTKVRLTGQDSCRGTFSHRHAVYVDQVTNEPYVPLNHLGGEQSTLQIYNSPLSEEACLGFEFGYSTADPWTLTIWEAQFGDFVNGAQVIIDQLIAGSEYKWGRMCGLVLLLPHGHEGQGPEHSSARPERFLELCAQRNMQVCSPTTPAQFFHLLRRQMKRKFRKPLVVMAPKSLLRHPKAVSSVSDLTSSGFRDLLPDVSGGSPEAVTRLVLCSGKVYYALDAGREEQPNEGLALARIEQLYPFPHQDYLALLASYPNLEEVLWVQEEPQNMGPWRHVRHRLERGLPAHVTLDHVARAAAAVPATGSARVHVAEEAEILRRALTLPTAGGPDAPAQPRERSHAHT